MVGSSLERIGALVRDARVHRGWTQEQLAAALGTSPSEVSRVERGDQNVSVALLARIGEVTDSGIVTLGHAEPTHLRVAGGRPLKGSIDVRASKNATVALLCASLLNSGRTTLRSVARIEEVHRITEVLRSLGVRVTWTDDGRHLEIVPPTRLGLDGLDQEAARRTRSVLLLLGPLMHRADRFRLPYAGGCDLGKRSIEPHLVALRSFGLQVSASDGVYSAHVEPRHPGRPIVLTERGDTVTENAVMAAALTPGTTVIRNASPNYMVQDLCLFLLGLGVGIEGIGTTTLAIEGVEEIDRDICYTPAEDPIEAMSLITAAILTRSEVTVRRSPVEFLEIELAVLEEMGLDYQRSQDYKAENGSTRLADITVRPSELRAHRDKIHPMPFPGLNIDNAPFFAAIGAHAHGTTLIHDWVYENRAIYLTELRRLGADVTLLDPHRITVRGPAHWSAAEIGCPPAMRPAVVILLAMLAAKGTSVLRNVYVIHRGYDDLARRLNDLGAVVETYRDI
ncbi:MAG: UDP-N-acetylglucosamine 1-carboxyvinyltransferase [Acidimicrobiales bacterium]